MVTLVCGIEPIAGDRGTGSLLKMLLIDREGTEATQIPGKKTSRTKHLAAPGLIERPEENNPLDEYPDCWAEPQPRKMIFPG